MHRGHIEDEEDYDADSKDGIPNESCVACRGGGGMSTPEQTGSN